MSNFDSENFPIACPHCDEIIDKPVRWYDADVKPCPHCGSNVPVESTRREIEQIRKDFEANQ